MNLLIIGAGRMGIRHCQGAAQVSEIKHICLVDISQDSLDMAKHDLEADDRTATVSLSFQTTEQFNPDNTHFDVGIIASTVTKREETLKLALDAGCKSVLVEKPLGQSLSDVDSLLVFADASDAEISVNLNMRLYEGFRNLKRDLNAFPQMQGEKIITLNTGSLGIGANGIHYLDILFFLLNASSATIVAGEVENTVIPSGRGPQFEDYGGWCTIKYFDEQEQYLGRAHLSMTSTSTVFGGWDLLSLHGRIRINELEQQRVDILRKPESDLPLNRYAGDYLPPEVLAFNTPFLGDVTRDWIEGLIRGEQLLPSVRDSYKTHKLLFDWLALNTAQRKDFSFT